MADPANDNPHPLDDEDEVIDPHAELMASLSDEQMAMLRDLRAQPRATSNANPR